MAFWSFGEKHEGKINPVEKVEEVAKGVKIVNEEAEKLQKYHELTDSLPKTKKMIGYKAVDNNYCAFYGNRQKYEIGKEYSVSGRLAPCKNGFHFCKTLEDVLELFPPQKGRHYLKVEGEVNVDYWIDKDEKVRERFQSCANLLYLEAHCQYARYGRWENPFDIRQILSLEPEKDWFFNDNLEKKYVTHKMKILEEVPFSEFADRVLDEIITSESEYYNTILDSQYEVLLENKIINYAGSLFSDAFIHYWIYKLYLKDVRPSQDSCINCFRAFKEKFDAIKDENISRDIRVLFMMGPN